MAVPDSSRVRQVSAGTYLQMKVASNYLQLALLKKCFQDVKVLSLVLVLCKLDHRLTEDDKGFQVDLWKLLKLSIRESSLISYSEIIDGKCQCYSSMSKPLTLSNPGATGAKRHSRVKDIRNHEVDGANYCWLDAHPRFETFQGCPSSWQHRPWCD
jgi:hypothetical protein